MNHIKQLKPNHAEPISYYSESFIDDMLKNEQVIGQFKYDGERMLIHILNGKVYCTSRRISTKTGKFVENQDKLRTFCEDLENNKFFSGLGYTVIDCECYSSDWNSIVSIIHSLPDKAYELSLQDPPQFACFDCLYYDGEDLTKKPYRERLEILQSIIEDHPIKGMHMIEFITRKSSHQYSDGGLGNPFIFNNRDEIQEAMQYAIDKGFEGIVLKSLDRGYYDKGAIIKCKKFETVDCVVIDKVKGTGKYSNTVGALKIGYYDPDKDDFVVVSQVNCGTDKDRNMWRDRWDELKYSVLEVKCQEVAKNSLRHPTYVRIRKDKSYDMCTKDTIFK